MNHPQTSLKYREEDRELLDLDQLSVLARVSRAFIQLCIDSGCPTQCARLSQAMLLEWLFENYENVRAASGLPSFAAIDAVGHEARTKLRMGNAVLTLLEFSESRASAPGQKRHLRKVQFAIEHALDRR